MQIGQSGFSLGDYVDIDISAGSKVGEFIEGTGFLDFLGLGQKTTPAPAPAPQTTTKTIIQRAGGIDKKWIIGGAAAAAGVLVLILAMKKKK